MAIRGVRRGSVSGSGYQGSFGLTRVWEFGFWRVQSLSVFEIFNFTVQYFKLKPPKPYSHQTRGHIANFKVEKNSWVSYGTKVLCFMF